MYEIFEHTADIGLRVRAGDLDTLFSQAARALMAQVVHDPEALPAGRTEEIVLRADRLDDLFRDWLQELLYLFETRRFVGRDFTCAVRGTGLTATVRGTDYDPARHTSLAQIKGVTYHRLKLEKRPEGYQAEVILDV